MKTKEQKNENTKGITLIALVITIIILIILAGVTINLTIGENGIFNKAKQAKEDYETAVNEEIRQIANVEVAIDDIVGGTEENGELTPPTVDSLKAGDYIKYNSGTNGIITCRVLYPASSEYGLQIISDTSAKDVELAGEDYAESVRVYNSAIEILNNEAENYINPEYAYDARCVGRAPTVENGMFINKDKVKFEGTTEYVTPGDANYVKLENPDYINSFAGDINYETDMTQLMDLGLHFGPLYGVWIASRYYDYDPTFGHYFYIRLIGGDGSWGDLWWANEPICLVRPTSGTDVNFYRKTGFAPCISLKSDIIKITGGDGKTADTAYIMGL